MSLRWTCRGRYVCVPRKTLDTVRDTAVECWHVFSYSSYLAGNIESYRGRRHALALFISCDFHCIPCAKIQLKGLLFSETESLMKRLGEKPDRAEVLFSWLYHDERLIQDVDESAARDDRDRWRPLGKETRKRLRAVATADGGLRLEVGENVALTPYRTHSLCVCSCVGDGPLTFFKRLKYKGIQDHG